MATATDTKKGFAAPCPRCGEEDCVRVHLDDVRQFTCASCDAEFDADDVRRILEKWAPVLAWIELAPDLTA